MTNAKRRKLEEAHENSKRTTWEWLEDDAEVKNNHGDEGSSNEGTPSPESGAASSGSQRGSWRRCRSQEETLTDSYEDPFEETNIDRDTGYEGFEVFIGNIEPGRPIEGRLQAMLDITEVVLQHPEVTKRHRLVIENIFETVAATDPSRSADHSSLYKIGLLCVHLITTNAHNVHYLTQRAWDSIWDMLVTSVTGKVSGERQAAAVERTHFDRDGATRWTERNRGKLMELAKVVVGKADLGPEAPKGNGQETAVTMLLNCLISLVVNSDRHSLVSAASTGRSFSRTTRMMAKVGPVARVLNRVKTTNPIVTWAAGRVPFLVEELLPSATMGVRSKLMYYFQLLSRYASVQPGLYESLAGPISEVLEAGEQGQMPLWIMLHVTARERRDDAALACVPAVGEMLEKGLGGELVKDDDKYDEVIIGINIIVNVLRGRAPPVPALPIPALVGSFFTYSAKTQSDSLVLSGYLSLLLCTISLTSEEHRISIAAAIASHPANPPDNISRPLAVLVANLQEFVTFQSSAGVLTKDNLAVMSKISDETMAANELKPTVDSQGNPTGDR
eukprot:TRINITY_DN1141_c4_g1_i1.p1 TRINITY_DN1141_c4_g1~~TRINITY_DN1141_c4_g1_i1.p1  ORF type:complete len:560 (+),score=151.76 TRINITY_DN1141_c4_g1_i1:75-1754(+)